MNEYGNNNIEINNTPVNDISANNTEISDELSPDNVNGNNYSANHKFVAAAITLVSAATLTAGGLFSNSFLSSKPVISSDYYFTVYDHSIDYNFEVTSSSKYQLYFEVTQDTTSIKKLNITEAKRYISGQNEFPKIEDLNSHYRYQIKIFYTNGNDVKANLLNFAFFTPDEGEVGIIYNKNTIDSLKIK